MDAIRRIFIVLLFFHPSFATAIDTPSVQEVRDTILGINAQEDLPRSVRTQRIVTDCIAKASAGMDVHALAFSVFNHIHDMRGAPAKIGTEICLARTSNLPIHHTTLSIARSVARGYLVRVHGEGVVLAKDLSGRQYATAWTRAYIARMAKAFWKLHQKPMRFTSLVRTATHQKKLARRGMSPADCSAPEKCSTHTTGASFDIRTHGLAEQEHTWIADYLAADMRAGKVLFILEAKGGHFHVFVPKPRE